MVEKPFGHDLASAKALNEELQEHFAENEVFRIDHYLGKETVQNMLALRFANGIFEPIWNRQFIDHVQITVAESMGIEGRAAYYDSAGAIRDIFQNHLLQLLAITAMEPPIDFTADSVRNEKVKVLRSMHTPGPKHVVRGQYGRGFVEGVEVPAYREEQGVPRDSMTETFIAAKLFVDNWRWADTPFYVRAGKRLARRETTIAIQFKRAPHPPFAETPADDLRPNVLLVHIQPDEGVSLAIGAKVPGQGMTIRTVHMDFLYGGAFRTGLPGGVRAADPRRDARRRDAVHALGRDRGAVVARRRDRGAVGARPALVPELRGRHLGPEVRPTTCSAATAASGGATDGDRAAGAPDERPRDRARAREPARRSGDAGAVPAHERRDPPRLGSRGVGRGGGGRARPGSPSGIPRGRSCSSRGRTTPSGIEAEVSVACHPAGGGRQVCTETIRVRLGGERAEVAWSVVQPLLLPDLPVFLRWRDLPPFGRREFDGMLDVVDRLIVDSHRVGAACRSRTRSSRRSSTASPSRTSPGRGRAAGGRCSPRSGRGSPSVSRIR